LYSFDGKEDDKDEDDDANDDGSAFLFLALIMNYIYSNSTFTLLTISRKHDNGIVLDNGLMIFNASSSKGGELSFLNNTVAAYKDMIDLRRGNLTTIAWEWK
jgi:hypothetical protein